MRSCTIPPAPPQKTCAGRKNHEIGILLPNLDDPYYVQIFQGIEKAFSNSDYFLNIAFSDDAPELERAALEGFSCKQVCGLILVSCQPDAWKYYYDRFTSRGCPIVMIDRRIKSLDANFVSVDSETSVRQLASALLQQGFRSVFLSAAQKALPVKTGVWRLSAARMRSPAKRFPLSRSSAPP